MMEGISSEAASLAGHLQLANLCWIYDNNHITIEGNTALAFSDDVATRFIGYGWNVTRVGDANDLEMLERAFDDVQGTDDRPTLIIVDSHIGYGAPHKQDTQRRPRRAARRGGDSARPSGTTAGRRTAKFLVPDGVREHFRRGSASAAPTRAPPGLRCARATGSRYPVLADQLDQMQRRELPDGWDRDLPTFAADPKGMATSRVVRARCSNAIARNVPWLIGGAADLAPSTKTRLTFDGAGDFEARQLRRPQLSLRHPRARDVRRS